MISVSNVGSSRQRKVEPGTGLTKLISGSIGAAATGAGTGAVGMLALVTAGIGEEWLGAIAVEVFAPASKAFDEATNLSSSIILFIVFVSAFILDCSANSGGADWGASIGWFSKSGVDALNSLFGLMKWSPNKSGFLYFLWTK